MYRLLSDAFYVDDVRTTSRKRIAGPFLTRGAARQFRYAHADTRYLVTSRVTTTTADDEMGTATCSACAEAMANSGVFADEFHLED